MIERYTRPEMKAIWTEQNKFEAWLKVELLACEAWSELGVIPKEDVALLFENATFDVNRINEIEQETRHDVIAFTRAVSETLGEERKWVHYGLTSTDVVDTALSYLLKQANDILAADLDRFLEILNPAPLASSKCLTPQLVRFGRIPGRHMHAVRHMADRNLCHRPTRKERREQLPANMAMQAAHAVFFLTRSDGQVTHVEQFV